MDESEDARARAFGYEDAAALRAAVAAERAKLPPEVRESAEQFERDVTRKFW
jgi:hypothetical protein